MLHDISGMEFLRTGLGRYPDARETVDYFETTLMNAVLAAFATKRDWKHFVPTRDSDGALESGRAIGPVDRYIHAFIAGAAPRRHGDSRLWLSLGVYWKPRRATDAPVVASCNSWISDRGGAVSFADIASRDQRVILGPLYKKGERRLFLRIGDQFDPVEDFALLLESADEALGPAEASDRPGPEQLPGRF
jgi:hypothetical protein